MAKLLCLAGVSEGMDAITSRDNEQRGFTRRSTSLTTWMDTLVRYVRSGQPDLTNRQMALMMIVYAEDEPETVRGLAEKLRVAKPVITRALNRLSQLGFIRRERDLTDRRNIFIRPTPRGADFLDQFNRFVAGNGGDERDTP